MAPPARKCPESSPEAACGLRLGFPAYCPAGLPGCGRLLAFLAFACLARACPAARAGLLRLLRCSCPAARLLRLRLPGWAALLLPGCPGCIPFLRARQSLPGLDPFLLPGCPEARQSRRQEAGGRLARLPGLLRLRSSVPRLPGGKRRQASRCPAAQRLLRCPAARRQQGERRQPAQRQASPEPARRQASPEAC